LLFRQLSSSKGDSKPVKIRQVDLKKISKVQRIKYQNFDQNLLFGAKTKKDEEQATESTVDKDGMQSEIFWTLEHDADVKKMLKNKKKAAKNEQQNDQDVELKPKKKTYIKKIVKEKTPVAFARFKSEMPKPVKVTIKDALDDLDSHINPPPVDSTPQQDIPFDSQQLKSITSFPLVLRPNDLIFKNDFKVPQKNPSIFTPSVTKILQATMSVSQRNALIQWKNLKIAELGLEGFELLQKSYLSRGKKFHECVQNYFSGVEVNEEEISTDVKDIWQSIMPVLHEFEAPALFTEQYVTHPYLHYKGVVDCVSCHDDVVTVIEWKNSDRHKKTLANTYDAPIQLCAYVAALNATEFKDKEQIKKGVVVVAYNDGQSADMFKLNEQELNKYWKLWLNRVQEYWTRYRDNTLTDEKI
jgi:genome maintenance exonuclease 1